MLAEVAAAKGHDVQTVGLPGAPDSVSIEDARPAHITVLPIPIAERDGKIPTPISNETLPLEQAAHLLSGTTWGGEPGAALGAVLQRGGVTMINPNDIESYAIANAHLSAEGAIVSALVRYPGTIQGARVLIVGYGRIARVLARLLDVWGANVIICARNPDARAWAQADGHLAHNMDELKRESSACDILFQTAPVMLVDSGIIGGMKRDALISDLTRGGVDIEAAESLGLTAWRDSGIPGKYAPAAAAKILYELIISTPLR